MTVEVLEEAEVVVIQQPLDGSIVVQYPDDVESIYVGDQGPPGPTGPTGPPGAGTPGTIVPLMDGTPAVGASTAWAHDDHVHPTDTSRAAVTYVDTQDALKVAKTGDTMTGILSISAANAAISLVKSASGQAAQIIGMNGASTRWRLDIGDAAAESTSNLGSNFSLNSFTDAGGALATPLTITRSSGNARFNSNLGIGADAGGFIGYTNTITGVAMRSDGFSQISGAGGHILGININADGQNTLYCRSGVVVGSISVTTTATAFNTSSDGRLKEDLRALSTTEAGSIIDNTEVYDFRWKETGARAYGVIAQQAAPVYATPAFHDEETDRWFIDYSKYVPVLLRELQALRARVAQLETELAVKPT